MQEDEKVHVGGRVQAVAMLCVPYYAETGYRGYQHAPGLAAPHAPGTQDVLRKPRGF